MEWKKHKTTGKFCLEMFSLENLRFLLFLADFVILRSNTNLQNIQLNKFEAAVIKLQISALAQPFGL